MLLVKPERRGNNRKVYRERWWIHGEPRPEMRAAVAPLTRFVITPRVSKHRLFAWAEADILADSATFVFARDDDYFFGVLHSRVHEFWALKQGTQLESRPRYTPTTCFETFPFPWPPGTEPVDDPRVVAIGDAARELNGLRERWLNPVALTPSPSPDSRLAGEGSKIIEGSDVGGGGLGLSESELKKRTLTNLYNERPQWLVNAHRKLDEAVFAAYGWPADLEDGEVLARLLALNLERADRPSPPTPLPTRRERGVK